MKERPILFSGPMVRALLAGAKTQTRRIVKPQPTKLDGHNFDGMWSDTIDPVVRYFVCPYGQVGDQLYVRENFYTWAAWDSIKPSELVAATKQQPGCEIFYCADYRGICLAGKLRPSIHLPRHLSRILLEVVSVRIERVQQITEADAQAEGVTLNGGQGYDGWAKQEYSALWDHLNLKRGFGWSVNPWVWVVEFRRIA
jgi:hypothetical protein